MIYQGNLGEYFELRNISKHNREHLTRQQPDTLRMLWFTSDNNEIIIDAISYTFHTNEIVFLTQFHQIEFKQVGELKLLRFNRPFYCILDHDSEVGCKGILYYGTATFPVIKPNDLEIEILQTAWKMAVLEFEMHDNLQLEMLQMMLKRILILSTRIYKSSSSLAQLDIQQNNLLREFNYLVESNFKEKHSVVDYADMLFKSPKTIANTFKKLGEKTPLQFIQERLMLEARRLLWHTEKDISQIAYEIGFSDIQAFSRFFKNQEGISPSHFRLQMKEGKN